MTHIFNEVVVVKRFQNTSTKFIARTFQFYMTLGQQNIQWRLSRSQAVIAQSSLDSHWSWISKRIYCIVSFANASLMNTIINDGTKEKWWTLQKMVTESDMSKVMWNLSHPKNLSVYSTIPRRFFKRGRLVSKEGGLWRPVPRHNINFGINTLCLGANLRDSTEFQGNHQVTYGQGRSQSFGQRFDFWQPLHMTHDVL